MRKVRRMVWKKVRRQGDRLGALRRRLPWEIAALAHLGKMDEARSLADRFLALEPNASVGKIRRIQERILVAPKTLFHPLHEGLYKAGVPK